MSQCNMIDTRCIMKTDSKKSTNIWNLILIIAHQFQHQNVGWVIGYKSVNS